MGMRIVILTGAGISAESGVATFRDADGLWEGHNVQEVATPDGFLANPDLVLRFYDERRANLATVEPNAAHLALAELEQRLGDDVLVVTQNVDDLHERAGSKNVIHMHGQLRSALCMACDERFTWDAPMANDPACPGCAVPSLRPDIVWFGEIPYRMNEIQDALLAADVFVAIGTSSEVYPAAGFVALASEVGARTVELNLHPSRMSSHFDEVMEGPASEVVPRWVRELA